MWPTTLADTQYAVVDTTAQELPIGIPTTRLGVGHSAVVAHCEAHNAWGGGVDHTLDQVQTIPGRSKNTTFAQGQTGKSVRC